MTDQEFQELEYPTPEPVVPWQMGNTLFIVDGRHLAAWTPERPEHIEPMNGVTGASYEKFNGAYLEDSDPELEQQALAAYKANPPEYEPIPEGMV